MSTPLGIRLRNPLNIKRGSALGGVDVAWRGVDPVPQDETFVTFIANIYGIRAAARIIGKYRARGISSVHRIIFAWAPPSDKNDSVVYASRVAQRLHVGVEAILPNDEDTMVALISAMKIEEVGHWGVLGCEYRDGVRLALQKDLT